MGYTIVLTSWPFFYEIVNIFLEQWLCLVYFHILGPSTEPSASETCNRCQMCRWIMPPDCCRALPIGVRSGGLGLILVLKGLWKSCCIPGTPISVRSDQEILDRKPNWFFPRRFQGKEVLTMVESLKSTLSSISKCCCDNYSSETLACTT